MNRHAYDRIFHYHFVEQHHLRPDDIATRTPPVFSREAMGFKMPVAARYSPSSRPPRTSTTSSR